MADPLSIAGLALAVVSLGLQVTGGITEYFDSLKSRDQDIASIIQQNNTLRKTLRIIDSSISRFQNDHRTATEPLRQFLDSCNEELKVLESLVAALITDDQGTTGRRTKARNKGKKLLYPFHRPKLEQMATKLHHINATLQLGLQSLGLSVSHLGSEKLATIQATSQTISSDLLVVRSEVSAISTPIQGIQSTVSQFETRFDGLENLLRQLLVRGSTINGTLQEITPAMLTGRLLGKPAVLQEMCDAVGTGARNKPNRNLSATPENTTEIRRAVTRYSGGRFSCICHRRRHFQRKNAAWGPLRFSHETKIERHTPGCPATEAITEIDRSSKFALTYVGLRSLLNSAIQLSFSVRSGAGGWSFGPNFTYYPMVDSRSAPAFRMLTLLDRSHFYLTLGLHEVARIIKCYYGQVDLLQSRAEYQQSSPLLDLLQYLLANKAPANDYSAYDLILRANVEDALAQKSRARTLSRMKFPDGSGQEIEAPGIVVLLHFLSCSTQVARDKPSILRVLVEAADAELLNQTDGSNDSALELAVTLSALNCKRQKAQMYNLSSTNIEELGLRLEYVLDYNAFQVTQLLEQSGTQVPASLAIIGSEMFSRPLSVYEKLDSPEDADIFFRAGFKDTWAWRPQKTSSESNTSSVTEFMEGSGIKENPLVELIGDFIIYLEQFFCDLRPRDHYATIRYITHVALGIHHSCWIHEYDIHQDEDIFDDVGGRLEDDENYKLELLDDLLEEFEESITSILEDPDKGVRDLVYFWEIIWVSRMSEVLDRLEGSELPEEERLGAEEIGVVWDNGRPEPPTKMRNTEMGNPYLISTIEHWLYELRKIEEECQ
ncbi:hypothetical protein FANTH_688 [Fusarium anthophilum]|uniref:Fungal N-terminal domain-containing protein n=1 Tax=Fusarium anthophilum TaxID=48485 RepID=A0A8H4ZYQ7_9HYPO|nr:hypothetical protein FANTH_688 [Fusarium anthophilum]